MRLIALFLLLAAAGFIAAGNAVQTLHFPLIRSELGGGVSRLEHLRAAVFRDGERQRAISSTILRRRRAAEASSFEMPMRSGAYAGTGQYFVRLRLGTPAQPFMLVADTGSDLTWVNCRYRDGPAPAGRRLVFRADKSRSFAPVPCSSDMCKRSLPFSITQCPTPAAPCAYDYQYADGSSARGFFANESATVTVTGGRKRKLKGLLVGCTSASVGSSFQSADGVMGLGHSGISFASDAVGHYGGRFSYCLVDHLSPRNASGYLVFGRNPAIYPGEAQYTDLILSREMEPFYAVGVEGISVDGEMLPIPAMVWDASKGGGVIIDSGTSLTVLAQPAYAAVTAALTRRLAGMPRVDVDPFEYCYNWTSSPAAAAAEGIPKLAVHFSGSAQLEPPVKSYVIDVAPGVKCIGLVSAKWPGTSMIGNILQQEYLWEFDTRNQRLGFQPSRCVHRH